MNATPNLRTLSVGIGSRNYGYRRAVYALPVERTAYRKVLYAPWKFLRRDDPRWANTYLFRPCAPVDLYHLWNGICLNRAPWVTTFESDLPRYCGRARDWLYELSIRRLHAGHCRRILALSDAARHRFGILNRGLLDDAVLKKTQVFYGGVEVRDDLVREHARVHSPANDRCVLSMVGHLFYQKGGIPVLRAFARLKQSVPGVRLIVISRLERDAWVTRVDDDDHDRTAQFLRSDGDVDWRDEVPHGEVLELMIRSHAVLLPTLEDTFGWSAVEGMSVGCPVISTNVCAMPETVKHGVNGYRIELPLQENRRWQGLAFDPQSPERARALEEAYETIADGIEKYVLKMWHDREEMERMSRAAVEHVRAVHDPQKQARTLRRIYDEALE